MRAYVHLRQAVLGIPPHRRADPADGGRYRRPARHENFQNTIQRLLELDAIPIINENDTVSVAEFGIGDNDTLSAIVATSVRADLLVLLSDIDGLYTADPHKNPDAQRIDVVPEITDDILRLAEGKGSSSGPAG